MARDGLLVSLCALVLLIGSRAWSAPPGDDREQAVAAALAVQTAMQQAREHLLQKNPRAAVDALESQLARINGNPHYLLLLRDAYRAHIRELKLANQDVAALVYMQRLNILEPGAYPEAKATAAAPKANPPAAQATKAPPPTTARLAANSGADPGALPKPTAARGMPDDPFQPSKADLVRKASELAAKAEQEFSQRRYRDAGMLYEKAHELNKEVIAESRERWAYCKLFNVVEQLNQLPASATPATALEAEVRQAMELAPRLDYAKQLLCEIEKRRKIPEAAPASRVIDKTPEPSSGAVTVRHGERTQEGWLVAETTNFRIYHNQSREMAEQAGRVAERTRADMQKKWFGATGPSWNPRCEIYLHANGQDYSQATHAPSTSPGHSSFNLEVDGGRLLSRRIDLHCDDMNLLVAVLPHEATHAVLAGNFGKQPVPRWADEGMAVLSEPRELIERHLRNLPQHRYDHQLFSMRQLIQMNDYPDPAYVGAFYAQSVSLVDFLVKEKGAQVFTQFVHDGMRGNYEQALQHHYGFQNFEDLEARWVRFAFQRSAGIASGK